MKIAVVGTGYVGLVTGTCFAETGNNVTCVDIDKSKVEKLSSGQITIYEPGLEKLFLRNQKEGRLTFTTSLDEGVKDAAIIWQNPLKVNSDSCDRRWGTPHSDRPKRRLSTEHGRHLACGASVAPGAGDRRARHRQGADGVAPALSVAALESALREAELRGAFGKPAGGRAVRP